MLFERIVSEGLAHHSYLIGDGGKAVVIDPRRDCEIYLKKAQQKGILITQVLETHRNEDYVIGSVELASRTSAQIWHADSQWQYKYGRPVEEGRTWKLGGIQMEAVHTPGHTPGSMSYLLREEGGSAVMIFTGDVLFAGEVGRVDLMGMDRAHEMAEKLYHSLFEKILPLGDGVIVCPAHGAGSVCGSSISERPWTTIGLERKLNPKLGFKTEEEFIAAVAKELERPPYFRKMEELNMESPPLLAGFPHPKPLLSSEFASRMDQSQVLDTRLDLGFSAAHIPGALSIWSGGISSFAGWFLSYDQPILLVNESDDPDTVYQSLIRLGYDNIEGFLSGSMLSWHTHGKKSASMKTLSVQDFCRILDEEEMPWILDVRSKEELETEGRIPNALHIHITQLPIRAAEVPKDKPVYIFCGSGLRSMIAASFLSGRGWTNLSVILGGVAGWTSITCPIDRA
jgi:hydroxyacylglutathione hydrolase